MPLRQPRTLKPRPLPKIWLMTDPKLGEDLLNAIQRLPFGSGVVFRHYQLGAVERRALYNKVRRICVRRGHVLLLAGDTRTALRWHAYGAHGRIAGALSMPVHNAREVAQAKRLQAGLVFLSPLYATSSHAGARPLGPTRFTQLAKLAHPAKVIALGGMTRSQAAKWGEGCIHGWAAIDAFKR